MHEYGVTSLLAMANAMNVLGAAADNPLLEFLGNNMSVGAILAVFWWREAKARERCEQKFEAERKLRLEAENKCSKCPFVKRANEEFMEKRE